MEVDVVRMPVLPVDNQGVLSSTRYSIISLYLYTEKRHETRDRSKKWINDRRLLCDPRTKNSNGSLSRIVDSTFSSYPLDWHHILRLICSYQIAPLRTKRRNKRKFSNKSKDIVHRSLRTRPFKNHASLACKKLFVVIRNALPSIQ